MIGCIRVNEKLENYKLFDFSGERKNTLITEGSLINSKEQGYFKFYEYDKIISEGEFNNGLRTGVWKYYGRDSFFVNWERYNYPSSKININYPDELEVIDREATLFFAKPQQDTSMNNYFIVLSHTMDSVQLSVNEYVKLFYNTMTSTTSVESYIAYKIENENREFYHFEYAIRKEGQLSLMLSLITHQDNQILDFTYVTKYDDRIKDKTIFFQMITSCYINNERILSPMKDLEVESITIESI